MLTPTTRLRLQSLIGKIARGQSVTLGERIYVQKFADRDRSVAGWLRRAQRQARLEPDADGIDRLLAALDLGDADPAPPYRPGEDDIGDWLGGAPPWLRRS
jgi:hypothetical protein